MHKILLWLGYPMVKKFRRYLYSFWRNSRTHHIFVSSGDAPGAITLNVVWMEREFDAYKLPRCMCPSKRYSEIFVKKSAFYHTPLHSTPPLGGFPSEYRHPFWCRKTRMVSLPDGEKISKISLFVLAQLQNVTDRRTDGHRVTAIAALCIASHGKHNGQTSPSP